MDLKSRMLRLLREDEEFRYAVAGLIGLDEILRKFEKYDERFLSIEEEIKRLREDMNRGFELVNRHISALGARWGLIAEEAFREGLKNILEKEFGLKVEKWRAYDEGGIVFGYPSEVEVDIAVRDGRILLIEVSSHAKAADVLQFKKKAELYEKKTGKRPDRLLMVTPYIDEKAVEASRKLGIEVCAKI